MKSIYKLKILNTELIKITNLSIYSLVLFAGLLIVFSSCSTTKPNLSYANIDFQGHRGARGLFPENTLPAFKAAMDLGVVTLELDTVLTKDKQLIIHHDNNLNSENCIWKNGSKVENLPIANFTVSELKELDCGSLANKRFPNQTLVPGTKLSTLTEFFKFVKEYEAKEKPKLPFQFNIETKINVSNYSNQEILEYARIMTKTIEEANVTKKTIVQSFVLEVLPEIKKINPEIRTSALFAPTKLEYIQLILGFSHPRKKIIEKTKAINAEIISPYYEYVNDEFIQLSKKDEIKVIPWTVNDKKLMRKMIHYGVDGLISDYPNKFKSLEIEE